MPLQRSAHRALHAHPIAAPTPAPPSPGLSQLYGPSNETLTGGYVNTGAFITLQGGPRVQGPLLARVSAPAKQGDKSVAASALGCGTAASQEALRCGARRCKGPGLEGSCIRAWIWAPEAGHPVPTALAR